MFPSPLHTTMLDFTEKLNQIQTAKQSVLCVGLDPDLPLTDWLAGFGLGAGEDGPLDDPEGDGYPNLVEFALDGDPSRVDGDLLGGVTMVAGEIALTFTPRDAACPYVRIVAEESDDLLDWSEAGVPVAGSDGSFTVSTDQPFLRLRVEVMEL